MTVAIAGRIMAIRQQGKAGFATLQQGGERLQIYVRLDAVGEKGFALYKYLDLGDHIGGGTRSVATGSVASDTRVVDHHGRALPGQLEAVAAPDAPTAAGDQDNLSGQRAFSHRLYLPHAENNSVISARRCVQSAPRRSA